jgi:mannosyltransferase
MTRRRAVAVAVLPSVLACVVYLWALGAPALWLDEAATARESARSLSGLLGFLAHRDAGLGAYYLAMWAWTSMGDAEWWLRFPSAMAMAVGAGVTADLARRWWGSTSGLVAGVLMAVSPMASRYAQEARPYALVVAVGVLSVWLLLRAVRTDRWRWWAAYAAVLTLLGLLHLVAVLIVVAHPVFVVARGRLGGGAGRPAGLEGPSGSGARREPGGGGASGVGGVGGPGGWWRWAIATTLGLVPPAALATVVLTQRATVAWIPAQEPGDLVDAFVAMAGSVPFLVLLAALAVVGVRPDPLTAALLVWLVAPPLLLFGVGALMPAFLPRYLLASAPALVLLAAARLARRKLWTVPVVAVVAAAVAWTPLVGMRAPAGHGPDLRAAARVVAAECRTGDAAYQTLTTAHTLPYYLRGTGCDLTWLSGGLPPGVLRVWIVVPQWQNGDPSGVTGLRPVRTTAVPGARVMLWERPRR